MTHAKQLIEAGNYQQAFMELNQALAAAPRDPNVHLNLGWVYLFTSELGKATNELDKAKELAPDLGGVYHLEGALKNAMAQQESRPEDARRDQEAAIESLKKALEKDPKNDQAYLDMATSLAALDRNQEALDYLDKGFDFIPTQDLDTQVNFEIASCSAHAKLQMFEEAIADCKQAEEFTTNPATKQHIEDMIENMKLLNPTAVNAAESAAPVPDSREAKQAEENAVINEGASD